MVLRMGRGVQTKSSSLQPEPSSRKRISSNECAFRTCECLTVLYFEDLQGEWNTSNPLFLILKFRVTFNEPRLVHKLPIVYKPGTGSKGQ